LKNDSISAYLRELSNDNNTDYSLWKATKKLNRPVTQIPPIRKTDGKWATNNEQKVIINKDIAPENEEIKLVTATEVKNEINNNINPKKLRDLIL
jgi:hypothetical protein